MSKRFKDYRRFKVYTWRPDPRPEARNADGGPQGRAGPARSPPCSRGPVDQPGPEEARAASSGADVARVRRLGTTPGPAGCPFCPCAAAQTPATPPPRPGRPAPASRSRSAPILRPPPEIRLYGPPLRPPPGTSPAGRRPAYGRGGSCTGLRAPIAPIHEGRDSEQDGARLLAMRLGGGTLVLMKLVHWSEAKWGGATHVAEEREVEARPRAVPGAAL